LLRFLQDQQYRQLGGSEVQAADVRIIAASNANLSALSAQGTFRLDLLYRLNVMRLTMPPLRHRQGDVGLLSESFLRACAVRFGAGDRRLHADSLTRLEAYRWPGNVRELENRVKRAVIMADGRQVTAADLDLASPETTGAINLRQVREAADRSAIRHALARADGNISATAKLLGISRPTLYDLLKSYDLHA
jgi:two-component system NtrC family response regulator